MKNFRILLLLFAGYYYYFIVGCFVAIRGFLLPHIKDDFNINYTISGLMILITALPGFIASLFSGYVFTSVNKKFLLIFSSSLVFVFFLLIPCSNSYLLFLIFSLFNGLGSFLMNTAVNVSLIDTVNFIRPRYKDNAVVLLHFIYSSGSSLILLLSNSLFNNMGWRNIYLLFGIAVAAVTFILIFSGYPERITGEEPDKKNFNTFFSLIFNKKMFFYLICIFFYGGLEFCLISWAPVFLQRGFNLGIAYSSKTMLIFFVLYCIGRLFGVLVIHRMDKLKLLVTVLCLSMICLVIALFFRIRLQGFDIFISVTGLFFSIVFPAVQNLVTSDFKDDLGTATSLFLIANSIGASFLPFITGILNDLFTARYGLVFISTYFVFIIPSLILAVKIKNRRENINIAADVR